MLPIDKQYKQSNKFVQNNYINSEPGAKQNELFAFMVAILAFTVGLHTK